MIAAFAQGAVDAGSFINPRRAAFWVFLVLTALGISQVLPPILGSAHVHPVGSAASAILFSALIPPFLLVIRRLDSLEREPTTMMVAAFVWGGVTATGLALVANGEAGQVVSKILKPELAARWSAAIVGPINEELLKTLGIIALALIARRQFQGPLDGYVYGALVGLGFQIVEDHVYAMNALQAADEDSLGPVFGMFFVRGILSAPWSHALYSGIAGIGVGWAASRGPSTPRITRLLVVFVFLWIALAFHFFWNSPLLTSDSEIGSLGMIVAFKGLPFLVTLTIMVLLAQREDNRQFRAAMSDEVAAGTLDAADLETLTSFRGRRRARRDCEIEQGRKAAHLLDRLQRAELALGAELVRGTDPTGLRVTRLRNDVQAARRTLAAVERRPARPEMVVPIGRLVRVAVAAVVVAAVANTMLAFILVAAGLMPGGVRAIGVSAIVLQTITNGLYATALFWLLGRFSDRPGCDFRIATAIVVIFQAATHLGLLASNAGGDDLAGIGASGTFALFAMWVVSAGIFAWHFTTRGVEPASIA